MVTSSIMFLEYFSAAMRLRVILAPERKSAAEFRRVLFRSITPAELVGVKTQVQLDQHGDVVNHVLGVLQRRHALARHLGARAEERRGVQTCALPIYHSSRACRCENASAARPTW